MKKKLLYFLTVLLIIFLLRYPILKGAGHFLIYENEPTEIENLFVLSGSWYDRGAAAADLYTSMGIKKIMCTGEINSGHILAYSGELVSEPALTKLHMISLGVPDSVIEVIPKGTSTIEEVDIILNYCLSNNLEHCVLLTSKFHTRRVKMFVVGKLKRNGIGVHLLGAPAKTYKEEKWWKYEYGIIAVNNEYLKILYYLIWH